MDFIDVLKRIAENSEQGKFDKNANVFYAEDFQEVTISGENTSFALSTNPDATNEYNAQFGDIHRSYESGSEEYAACKVIMDYFFNSEHFLNHFIKNFYGE